MYQILKKQYRNYYVIEEHEDVADAKDCMNSIKLLVSHLKYKIKYSDVLVHIDFLILYFR